MKSFIAFAVLIAAALATPITPDGEAVILRYDNENIGVDGYQYAYETSNGIQAQEEAKLELPSNDNEAPSLSVRGQFAYPGPDGVNYLVTYIADKFGFRAEGVHLPQA